MKHLKRRVKALEGERGGAGQPFTLPFPPEDGETPEDIERKLAEWHARGPLTEEEWVEEFGAEDYRER